MKLELREVCTRFKEAVIKEFDERLTELKDKQPQYEYNRVKHKVNQRYYNWILGFADELGNRYTPAYYFEHANDVKRLLADHMVRLTNNKAIGLWLEKDEDNLWEHIIWDMYDIDTIHYSRVLYRFTYSVICHYLHFIKENFNEYDEGRSMMETQEKEKLEKGEDMYNSLEKQLTACLSVKKCAYWSTTEK